MGWFKKKKKLSEEAVSAAELEALASLEAMEDRDHEQDRIKLEPMHNFLERVPAVSPHGGVHEDDYWHIGLTIDLAHPLAWNVVQELGHFFNLISIGERLPTVFMPVSPPPYLNGGPEDCLSWIIKCDDLNLTPKALAESLEGRLPRPVEDLSQWLTAGEA